MDDDFVFPTDEQIAAQILVEQHRFNQWPVYYRNLLLCYSPWVYTVRYFQIILCIVNDIPENTYFLVQRYLNPHLHDNPFTGRYINKIQALFRTLRAEIASDPYRFRTYNLRTNTVSDITGNRLYISRHLPRPREDILSPELWNCIDHFINIGVADIFNIEV